MIPSQRHLFDLPDDVAYLNCAYMSPLLKHAVAAATEGIARKAQPWRIGADDFFTDSERARGLFARLLGATAEDIAVVPAASYGIAVAAANLPFAEGRRILMLAEQFPSNVYAWSDLARRERGEVVTVPRPADGDWSAAILARLDERVAITALPHCHWTDGGLIDLVSVAARCREVGSALVIDATQSLGALPFDLAAIRPDFLACAGYKWLLGPYSVSYLYVAPRWQDGQPLEHNWIARTGSENFAGLVDYQAGYQPGARRFDVGERANFGLMPAGHRRARAAAALGPAGDHRDARGAHRGHRRARWRPRPAGAAGGAARRALSWPALSRRRAGLACSSGSRASRCMSACAATRCA